MKKKKYKTNSNKRKETKQLAQFVHRRSTNSPYSSVFIMHCTPAAGVVYGSILSRKKKAKFDDHKLKKKKQFFFLAN